MEKHSSSPSASEVASTEGSVTAFMEILVDPLLHQNSKNAPTVEQQSSLAKQIHAVVLLYNYYQRKRHPELEYLGFESFCKLAVTLRPDMMPYLKVMDQFNKAVSDDAPEYQLTLTEEAIKDACNLCLTLDVPTMEEWPISRVVVLLVDSGKENCVVVFGSVTQGVWSFLEKSLDDYEISSGSTISKTKRRRINKNNLGEEQNATEAGHEQLAFSAIKESTGINEDDLMVLENHVVYSLSKEKTAVRFYVVKCRGTIKGMNKNTHEAPIKEILQSLQGPLVEKCMSSWAATSVAEHLHILPYAGIISKLFSSESLLKEAYLMEWHHGDRSQAPQKLLYEGLQTMGSDMSINALPNDMKKDVPSSCFNDLVSFSNNKSNGTSGATVKSPMKEDNIRSNLDGPTCSVSQPHNMNTFETAATYGHTEQIHMEGKVYQHRKKRTSTKNDITVSTTGVKNMVMPRGYVSMEQEDMTTGDDASLPLQSKFRAKNAALRVLLLKRDRLVHQLRNI